MAASASPAPSALLRIVDVVLCFLNNVRKFHNCEQGFIYKLSQGGRGGGGKIGYQMFSNGVLLFPIMIMYRFKFLGHIR